MHISMWLMGRYAEFTKKKKNKLKFEINYLSVEDIIYVCCMLYVLLNICRGNHLCLWLKSTKTWLQNKQKSFIPLCSQREEINALQTITQTNHITSLKRKTKKKRNIHLHIIFSALSRFWILCVWMNGNYHYTIFFLTMCFSFISSFINWTT